MKHLILTNMSNICDPPKVIAPIGLKATIRFYVF